MSYQIKTKQRAENDIIYLKTLSGGAYEKLRSFVPELHAHPQTGTGKPERLKGNLTGKWSRRITSEHRLVYEIDEENQLVLLHSAKGHYE